MSAVRILVAICLVGPLAPGAVHSQGQTNPSMDFINALAGVGLSPSKPIGPRDYAQCSTLRRQLAEYGARVAAVHTACLAKEAAAKSKIVRTENGCSFDECAEYHGSPSLAEADQCDAEVSAYKEREAAERRSREEAERNRAEAEADRDASRSRPSAESRPKGERSKDVVDRYMAALRDFVDRDVARDSSRSDAEKRIAVARQQFADVMENAVATTDAVGRTLQSAVSDLAQSAASGSSQVLDFDLSGVPGTAVDFLLQVPRDVALPSALSIPFGFVDRLRTGLVDAWQDVGNAIATFETSTDSTALAGTMDRFTQTVFSPRAFLSDVLNVASEGGARARQLGSASQSDDPSDAVATFFLSRSAGLQQSGIYRYLSDGRESFIVWPTVDLGDVSGADTLARLQNWWASAINRR